MPDNLPAYDDPRKCGGLGRRRALRRAGLCPESGLPASDNCNGHQNPVPVQGIDVEYPRETEHHPFLGL